MTSLSKLIKSCVWGGKSNLEQKPEERKWNGAEIVKTVDTKPRLTVRDCINNDGKVELNIPDYCKNNVEQLMHTVIPNQRPLRKPRLNDSYRQW